MPKPIIPTQLIGEPSPMTGRARAYLWISCIRTIPVAVACFTVPEAFEGPAFEYILGALPLAVWGVLLWISAILSAAAALTKREYIARVALVTSAAFAAMWSIGFAIAWFQGNLLSPVGVMWGLGIAAKDLVVCRQPLWSPFEPLVRRVKAGERLRSSPGAV